MYNIQPDFQILDYDIWSNVGRLEPIINEFKPFWVKADLLYYLQLYKAKN